MTDRVEPPATDPVGDAVRGARRLTVELLGITLSIPIRVLRVGKRTLVNTFNDGFTDAGNLAYLSLLTLFPFFIVVARIAGAFGRTEDGLAAVNNFLRTVPPGVAELLRGPVADVLSQKSNNVLTFGIVVGLWSTASFIETARSILRRAYKTTGSRPFWEYRLGSIALVIASVILMLVAFSVQVVLTGAEAFVTGIIPWASNALGWLHLSRLAPGLALFLSLYLLFLTLTPKKFRKGYPKWPGAALTTGMWVAATMILPWFIGLLGGYDRTYGSLAGVMIALIFFWVVGLGFVLGAELNAALAQHPKSRQKAAKNLVQE